MSKKMEPVEVFTTEGSICIKQSDGPEERTVFIHPQQLDVLIQWLCEARDELKKA